MEVVNKQSEAPVKDGTHISNAPFYVSKVNQAYLIVNRRTEEVLRVHATTSCDAVMYLSRLQELIRYFTITRNYPIKNRSVGHLSFFVHSDKPTFCCYIQDDSIHSTFKMTGLTAKEIRLQLKSLYKVVRQLQIFLYHARQLSLI